MRRNRQIGTNRDLERVFIGFFTKSNNEDGFMVPGEQVGFDQPEHTKYRARDLHFPNKIELVKGNQCEITLFVWNRRTRTT